MATDDHLDKETELSVKTSVDGFEAKAKSRFISGVDRLLGNLTEFGNVYLEEKTIFRRGRIEAQQQIMKSATASLASEIEGNKELALQIFQSNFSQMARRHNNKLEVVRAAVEELKQLPPSEEQANSGPEQLSGEFLSKFERYSEDASEDEVRTKWAKVLAAEVKSPGRFDAKVMRTLDEIDNKTASCFAEVVSNRIGTSIPKVFCDLSYEDTNSLQESGLVRSAFPGAILFSSLVKDNFGREFHLLKFDQIAFGFEKEGLSMAVIGAQNDDLLSWSDRGNGEVSIRILDLTKTGIALLEILEDRSKTNALKLLGEFRGIGSYVRMLVLSADNMWVATAD